MTKLLVPFDGSENAARALRHAIEQAHRSPPSSVHVVTVHDAPDLYGEVAVYVPREKMAELQERVGRARLEPAERLLREAGVSHSTEIVVGQVAEVIARRAEELNCNGIVMGTRGMSALGGLVMGSVATRVVHAANVPVTLVK